MSPSDDSTNAPGSDPDPGPAGESGSDGETLQRMNRRTLIRLLVGLGIGIPVAVEAATFLGLVGQKFGGGDGNGDGGSTAGTGTPTRRPVGVGDELLPETSPVERVTDMTLRATGNRWRFELTAEVRNDLDTAYEFRLGAVSTGTRTVEGGASTGTMASSETTTITGRWDLPEGEAPETVAVSAVVAVVGGETPRRHSDEVPLARVPVEG